MTYMHPWNQVIELGQSIRRGEPFEWTDEVRELLRQVATDVAIRETEVQEALTTPTAATALVREINRRIRDGSRRLSRALVDANRRKETGDIQGAREVLEAVLAVEVVPLYREQAEAALEHLE